MPFVDPYRTTGELNEIEQWKLERHPLEIVDAIIDDYSKKGPGGIKSGSRRGRAPEVGRHLSPEPGRRRLHDADQGPRRASSPRPRLREIGVVADAFGEGPDGTESRVFGTRYADLTTRQTVQIHWIRIEDVPRIWRRFAAVGLTTVQACGDSARNVLSCPVSGVDADEAFDALPVAQAVSDFFTGNREYANLPRKFKMSVTGCVEDCAQAEINDIGLWPARGGGRQPRLQPAGRRRALRRRADGVGHRRLRGHRPGGRGHAGRSPRSSASWATARTGAWPACATWWRSSAPRASATELAKRARFDLVPAGEELTRRYRGDHVGVHPQKQEGLFYVGCSVPVGRMNGIDLVEAARLAETYGDGTVRIGTDQNFVFTGVPDERVDALLGEELLAKYSPFPGPFARGVVACTGSEFCRFADRRDEGACGQVGALPRRAAGRRAGRHRPGRWSEARTRE